jgi:type II restriction enzyme
MKQTSVHKRLGISSVDQGFDHLISTLRPSLKLWEYFVNWDKVFQNTRALEVHLNLWNYLLGKENFDSEFEALLAEHPQIVSAIPSMVVRDGFKSDKFAIIEDLNQLGSQDAVFDFSTAAHSPESRASALEFVKKSGLERLFKKDGVKNLVDYVLGVEAGLDSNARKSRSGTSMEKVTEALISRISSKKGFEYVSQATAARVKEHLGFELPAEVASRRFDFAVTNGKSLVLIEVNFYGGGGSKLKATAGEYKALAEVLKSKGIDFVWITDGAGWKTAERPLREAFNVMDNIWNLSLVNEGCLEEVLS